MMRVGRRTKKRSFQPSMTTYARLPSMPCEVMSGDRWRDAEVTTSNAGVAGGAQLQCAAARTLAWTRILSPEPMGSPPLGREDIGA